MKSVVENPLFILPKKHLNFSELTKLPLEHGINMARLRLSELLGVSVDMTYPLFFTPLRLLTFLMKKSLSVTVVFPVHISQTIFKDKFNTYNLYTRNMLLFKILLQALILNAEDFPFWWNTPSQENYMKLSSLIKTESLDLDLTCLHSCSNLQKSNSWFLTTPIMNPQNKNLQMTFNPSYMSSLVDITEDEDTKKLLKKSRLKMKPMEKRTLDLKVPVTHQSPLTNTSLKVRKFKLKLTRKQKTIIQQWIHHARFSYNQAVEIIKSYPDKKEYHKFMFLRDTIVTKNTKKDIPIKKSYFDQLYTTPKEIRAYAVKKASISQETNRKHRKNHDLSFQKKKELRHSIVIPKQALSKKTDKIVIYPQCLGEIHFTSGKKNRITSKQIQHDFEIVYQHPGAYYMHVPIETHVKTYEKKESSRVVALDPGLRTFQTAYFNNGDVRKYGVNIQQDMIQWEKQLDMLQKRIHTARKTKNYGLLSIIKKEYHIALHRKRNRIRELHAKIIRDLLDRSDIVILPRFSVRSMTCSKEIRNEHTRRMNRMLRGVCHYQFQLKLVEKAKEEGKLVWRVGEEYTSRTCTLCGRMKDIGGDKIYECERCGYKNDRDVNGAMNIMKKTILERN
jgi:transposase